jgi:hypothetical protein
VTRVSATAPQSGLACLIDKRRRDVRAKGLNGVDDIEVGEPAADGSVTLCVHFLASVPEDVGVADVRIEGGRRICRVDVVAVRRHESVREDDDDSLEVVVDRAGDTSTYRLCLLNRGKEFDPFYACKEFTFTSHCTDDLDCAVPDTCALPTQPKPALDYLAKDYEGFRRLALDRLALLVPGWEERHVPDVGITLVELFAYTADYLSYYQDAVATEAYLGTARQRVSVRRHGRLVDYQLHEGCNARAVVVLDVDATVSWPVEDVVFLTAYDGIVPPGGPPLDAATLPDPRLGAYLAFEPLVAAPDTQLLFTPARNTINLHTWGDQDCCLPAGATSAWLVDDPLQPLDLAPGDYLVFEEVKGPHTGLPADADVTRRQVVRLAAVSERMHDGVEDVDTVEVTWGKADALAFALCISAVGGPDCCLVTDVSVARGNVIPVDGGLTIDGEALTPPPPLTLRRCEGEGQPVTVAAEPTPFRPQLTRAGLTFAEPLVDTDRCGHAAPAVELSRRDPRRAVPALRLASAAGAWTPVLDLLDSGPYDREFVVEMDDDRRATLRFGDGRLGAAPNAGVALLPRYRVGNGRGGNVGAESLLYVALRGREDATSVRVRNPLAASGGADPEPVADAKLRIPTAFRVRRERAITAADYAELAQRFGSDGLQRASAELVWTGSWYEADVALDERGGDETVGGCGCGCGSRCRCPELDCDPDDMAASVRAGLANVRRIGHDVRVTTADLVPVDVELTVCARADAVAAHVKAALVDALTDGVCISGAPGFFHPDNWTFGQALYSSALLSAALTVPGVSAAEVTRLQRQDAPARGELAAGALRVSPTEIVVLAGGRLQPRRGRLSILVRGGR